MFSQSALVETDAGAINRLLNKLLITPSSELRTRKSNKFRSRLVELGVELAGAGTSAADHNLKICCDAIESLHLGSLIIDDIQDGSLFRREGAALHTKLGTPHALSVGNWLYFQAMSQLSSLDIPASDRLALQNEWIRSIEWAHYGQVMDLATSIPEVALSDLAEVCHYTALYKTGCIAGLAITMGAMIAGASEQRANDLREMGCALGVYLQRLNDIGNLVGEFDSDKRFEDLASLKPSYVWPLVLENYGMQPYFRLIRASRELPQTEAMNEWLEEFPIKEIGQKESAKTFATALERFSERHPDAKLDALIALKNRITQAYE